MGYDKSAHLYDLFDTKDNIDFFLSYALEAGKILDIGAGTGRIAIPIAEKGVKVFCVEPSAAMKRRFIVKLAGRSAISQNITLVKADIGSFDFGCTFPAAILSGTFDHLLNDRERLSALKNIYRHLMFRGILVFDVFLGLMEEANLHPAGSAVDGHIEYRRFVSTRHSSQTVMTVKLVFEIYEKGILINRIEEQSQVGIIDRRHIHHLLDNSGFEVKNEFGGYSRSKYRPGDSLLIIEAVKNQIPNFNKDRRIP